MAGESDMWKKRVAVASGIGDEARLTVDVGIFWETEPKAVESDFLEMDLMLSDLAADDCVGWQAEEGNCSASGFSLQSESF
jgi:hypothetical protein